MEGFLIVASVKLETDPAGLDLVLVSGGSADCGGCHSHGIKRSTSPRWYTWLLCQSRILLVSMDIHHQCDCIARVDGNHSLLAFVLSQALNLLFGCCLYPSDR